MRRLSVAQKRVLVDFCTNIAVGWFIVGVVTPFLDLPKSVLESYVTMGVGFVMSYIFLRAALFLSGGINT